MNRELSDGYSTDVSAGSLTLPTSRESVHWPELTDCQALSVCSETDSISSPVAPRTPQSSTARRMETLLNLEVPPAPVKAKGPTLTMQSPPSERVDSMRSELSILASMLSTPGASQLYLWMPLETQALLQRYSGFMDQLVLVKPAMSSIGNQTCGYQVQIFGGSKVILVNQQHCSMISAAISALSTGFSDSWIGTLSELKSKVVRGSLSPRVFTLLVRCTLGMSIPLSKTKPNSSVVLVE